MAHSSLYVKEMEDKSNTINELATGFEGEPFIGPHSLALSEDGSKWSLFTLDSLYFTDSGPWGETSIENPRGSVFVIDVQLGMVRPLALNCLAYPSGLALAQNDKVLYVCETGKNRILRFNLTGTHFSMFR